jgi:transcriptional regulator with XRE-family HTH domain
MTTVPYDGDKIRKRREEAGLSLEELGERTGRHPEALRNLERNNKNASVAMVMCIVNALGIKYAEILPDGTSAPEAMRKAS